jgi:hypothetical protein
MYFEGGMILAKAAFTSGSSQVVGTFRSAAVGVGEGVAAGLVDPHAVKTNSRTTPKLTFFIAINLPDLP